MSAMPNVGFPQRMGDRVIYPKSSPEYFDLFAREAVSLGARILGGCCGTTPEHIRAMVRAVEGSHQARSARAAATVEAAPEVQPRGDARTGKRAMAENSGETVCHFRRDRSAERTSIERVLEQVKNVMASKQRGRHRHQ